VITEQQAADKLGITVPTMRNLRYKGKLSDHTIVNGKFWYEEDDIDGLAQLRSDRKHSGRPSLGDQKRVRFQCVIKPRLKSQLQKAASLLGLSEGAYIEKLLEET